MHCFAINDPSFHSSSYQQYCNIVSLTSYSQILAVHRRQRVSTPHPPTDVLLSAELQSVLLHFVLEATRYIKLLTALC